MKTPAELFSLDGKVAVVIGGTGELCGSIASTFAKAGARVVLAGRDAQKARARLDQIAADGGAAEFLACDTTSKAGLELLLDQTLAKAGRVDILVNGAGVNSATPFLDIAETEMDRILTVNFKGLFLACQVFGRHMVGRGSGSIINVGSASGLLPLSRVFTYSASKAAVHNLSKNLAREWAARGVRVNILVPGFFPAGTKPQGPQPGPRGGHPGQNSHGPVRPAPRAGRGRLAVGLGGRQLHHRGGNHG